MKWTIGRKIFLMGMGIVIAFVVLASNAHWSNSTISNRWNEAGLRMRQIDTTYEMLLANTELVLTAMDAIIDRNDGKINDERADIINSKIEMGAALLKR